MNDFIQLNISGIGLRWFNINQIMSFKDWEIVV